MPYAGRPRRCSTNITSPEPIGEPFYQSKWSRKIVHQYPFLIIMIIKLPIVSERKHPDLSASVGFMIHTTTLSQFFRSLEKTK
jgi:hypothetical protein